MDYKAVEKLYNNLASIKKELELLDFWSKYPEIRYIKIRHEYEYNYHDQNSCLSCHYIESIEFISLETQRALTLRCFHKEPNEFVEDMSVDPSEWDEVLEFTSLRCLAKKDNGYTRPYDVELEIKTWEERAQNQLLEYIKGMSLYPILEPGWNYVNGEYYLGATQVSEIYTNYIEAEQALMKKNITKAVNLNIEEIADHDRLRLINPDNSLSADEKLEYWQKHAPELLAEIVVATVE